MREIVGVLHCVEPVPRSTGVPMARFEPVQTAWATSRPPSMAMEAREIVKCLILAYGKGVSGCSGCEKHVFLQTSVGDSRLDFIEVTSIIARVAACRAWALRSTSPLLHVRLIQWLSLIQQVISYRKGACSERRAAALEFLHVQFKPQH